MANRPPAKPKRRAPVICISCRHELHPRDVGRPAHETTGGAVCDGRYLYAPAAATVRAAESER